MTAKLQVLVSMCILCLAASQSGADSDFYIERLWTTDSGGTSKREFLPGEDMRCYVQFHAARTPLGAVSTHLRAYGDGWNDTRSVVVPQGSETAQISLRIPSAAGNGKATLHVGIEASGEPSRTHGRTHTYVNITCRPGNFPTEYHGYVEVAPQPFDMMCTLDDKYLYVTSNQERTITVVDVSIDPSTSKPRFDLLPSPIEDPDRIGFGFPKGITLNEDGSHMLVADYSTGKIHVLDTSTHQWIEGRRVTNRKGLMGIAVNPLRNEIYLTDCSASSMIVCDGSTYEFKDEIPLADQGSDLYGANPVDIRVDSSGFWAYVLCPVVGRIIKIDVITREIVGWNDTPNSPIKGFDVAPDGRRVYGVGVYEPETSSSFSTIYEFDTDDLSLIRRFDVDHTLWDLVVRPDGRYAYAVDSYLGEVRVIDLQSGEALRYCSVPIGYGGKILQPTHGWTEFFVGRWTLGFIDAVGFGAHSSR